jgi:outer membrane protein assembly factor BamB
VAEIAHVPAGGLVSVASSHHVYAVNPGTGLSVWSVASLSFQPTGGGPVKQLTGLAVVGNILVVASAGASEPTCTAYTL